MFPVPTTGRLGSRAAQLQAPSVTDALSPEAWEQWNQQMQSNMQQMQQQMGGQMDSQMDSAFGSGFPFNNDAVSADQEQNPMFDAGTEASAPTSMDHSAPSAYPAAASSVAPLPSGASSLPQGPSTSNSATAPSGADSTAEGIASGNGGDTSTAALGASQAPSIPAPNSSPGDQTETSLSQTPPFAQPSPNQGPAQSSAGPTPSGSQPGGQLGGQLQGQPGRKPDGQSGGKPGGQEEGQPSSGGNGQISTERIEHSGDAASYKATFDPMICSFDDLWTAFEPTISQKNAGNGDGKKISGMIKSGIQSQCGSIPDYVILCIIMQESHGDVRAGTTTDVGGQGNPGLMQCRGSPSLASGTEVTQEAIDSMIKFGADHFASNLQQADNNVYGALRCYNSGSIAASKDLHDLPTTGGGLAEYVTDVANRFHGWNG